MPHEARFVPRCTLRAPAPLPLRVRPETEEPPAVPGAFHMRVQELAETAERTAEPGQRCRCQNTNTQDYTLQFRGHS